MMSCASLSEAPHEVVVVRGHLGGTEERELRGGENPSLSTVAESVKTHVTESLFGSKVEVVLILGIVPMRRFTDSFDIVVATVLTLVFDELHAVSNEQLTTKARIASSLCCSTRKGDPQVSWP